MDIIEMTRNLGREIQKDERFLKMQLAIQNTDNDRGLQDLIGQYNLKRIAIDNEAQKQNRDEAKVKAFSQELRGLYEQIMRNPAMGEYQKTKGDFDGLMNRVLAILQQSANGADPETADYEESSCGGDCSSCAGCH